VIEAALAFHQLIEGILAGVAEGGVAQVVGQGDALDQVLVEAEGARDRAGDLGHLDGVGEAGAVVVPLVVDEDLGLVLEPPEGGRVDQPVAVALESAPVLGLGLRMHPAPARGAPRGPGGEPLILQPEEVVAPPDHLGSLQSRSAPR
jgi:hypothetical protein